MTLPKSPSGRGGLPEDKQQITISFICFAAQMLDRKDRQISDSCDTHRTNTTVPLTRSYLR